MEVDVGKLAEFAGWTTKPFLVPIWDNFEKRTIRYEQWGDFWFAPDGSQMDDVDCPDFPSSLDACFRWLPEPLREKYEVVIFIDPVEDANFSKVGVRGIFKDIEYWERAEWWPWLDPKTPNRTYVQEVATALCKAVEYLMDQPKVHVSFGRRAEATDG